MLKKCCSARISGRGHHRRLVAVLHSRQHRAQAHQGLARANVSLDEAIHNLGTLHLRGDLGDDPELGACGGQTAGNPTGADTSFSLGAKAMPSACSRFFFAPPRQAQLERQKARQRPSAGARAPLRQGWRGKCTWRRLAPSSPSPNRCRKAAGKSSSIRSAKASSTPLIKRRNPRLRRPRSFISALVV